MSKLVKVFDPDETYRQIHFNLREEQAPGVLRFLASLPYGIEGAFWRGAAAQWIAQHQGASDIDAHLQDVISAGGGMESRGVKTRVVTKKARGRAAVKLKVAQPSPAFQPARKPVRSPSLQGQPTAASSATGSAAAWPPAAPPNLPPDAVAALEGPLSAAETAALADLDALAS
jgi:hypothetical protein